MATRKISAGREGDPTEIAPRVDRQLYRRPSARQASAGRVLAVGLLCFAIWTLFDANQLYHNAIGSPFGARRTAAIEILRPMAAVSDAIGLSVVVNAANRLLDRDQPSATSKLPVAAPPPVPPSDRLPGDTNAFGVAPRPHTRRGESLQRQGASPGVWPPPLAEPTRAHPLVLLDIGDSIGEDLGTGLADVFAGDPYVRVLQRGQISTGLARPDYYNWPSELAAELKQYHPGVVVVMMGANDDQSLSGAHGLAVPTSSPSWDRDYTSRIELMMDEATDAGAHVVWVGLPPLDAPSVSSSFALHLNYLIRQAAAGRSGVTYVSSWNELAGPKGTFVQYKKVDGSLQQIRYSDGVHLAPVGWDLLASYLLDPMEKALKVDMHAKPVMRLG